MATLALGLGMTAVIARRMAKAPEIPRPYVLATSLGVSLAFALAAYAATAAGKLLNLTPPAWVIGVFAVAAFPVVPAVVLSAIASFALRRRNRLYRNVWRFSLLVVVVILGLFLIPRTPPDLPAAGAPGPGSTQRTCISKAGSSMQCA